MNRTIRQVLTPLDSPGNEQVKRKRMVLEPGNWMATDPFLFLAEDWFQKPGGFPDHPHRGIETVTLVLDGELLHADNRGNSGVLRTNDVQWMTAGGGIIHAGLPYEESLVHSLQLWVNMPSTQKMVPSTYQDLHVADSLVAEDGSGSIRVISGDVEGASAPVHNAVPVLYLDTTVEAAGRMLLPVPASFNGFVYVLDGAAKFGADQVDGNAGQVLWLDYPQGGSGVSSLEVQAEPSTRFLLIAGEPIQQPVVAYGPFVMNTKDEIVQAFEDYRDGKFGGPTPAGLEMGRN